MEVRKTSHGVFVSIYDEENLIKMKLRIDFVTNSSSSSYVIARKNDCTPKDIFDLINTSENIEALTHCYGFDKETRNSEEILMEVANRLFMSHGMQLGEWMVCATELSNEEDIEGEFIYEGIDVGKSDIFKMEVSW